MTTPSASGATTSAGSTPASPASAPSVVDTGARQSVLALVIGLVMLLPLRAAVGTTTYDGLYGWILGGLLLAVALGFLARLAGVPQAISTVLCSAGCFALLVPIGLWLLARADDPGSVSEVALMVGLPSAGIATLASAVILHRMRDAAPLGAGVVCVVGFCFVAGAGDAAWRAVDDARQDAVDRAELESSGLSAYLPEFEDLEAAYSSTYVNTETGAITGVTLRYSDDRGDDVDYDAPSLRVELTKEVRSGYCVDALTHDYCRDGSGYVVDEYGDSVRAVVAPVSGGYLVATYSDGETGLPDADEVGRALAGAEEVEWQDILDLRD